MCHNIAWWFSAIVFLIVWVLVVLVWAGATSSIQPGALSFNAPVIVVSGAYTFLAINVNTFGPFFARTAKREIDCGSRALATLLGLLAPREGLGGRRDARRPP